MKMYKTIKRLIIAVILIAAGSTAINISSSMDKINGRVKVNTGLPIVTIYTNLDSQGNRITIDKENWVPARIEINDGSYNDYNGYSLKSDIFIKGRGHSSWNMPKKGYAIKFSTEQPVLGMAPGKQWVLIANYADKTLMRNSIAFDFARMVMDVYVPDYRYVELYLNDRFMGNYMLVEKIKIDKNRLNINKLRQDDRLNSDISGGYLLEIDMKARVSEDNHKYFTTRFINEENMLYIEDEGELLPVVISIREPEPEKLTEKQFEYIKNYILAAEEALFSDNFTDPEEGYAKYFDVDSFVDWYIVNELFMSVDAPMLTSVYMYKDAGGKLKMGPVWDFDLSMGLAGFRKGTRTEGLYVGMAPWFSRLLEDPAFVQKVEEKWAQIRENNIIEELYKGIEEKYEYLKNSQKENFKVWNIIGRYVWPEPRDVKPRKSYDEEVQYLKNWLSQRVQWFDSFYGSYISKEIVYEADDGREQDIKVSPGEENSNSGIINE